jgi:hypothetical protein
LITGEGWGQYTDPHTGLNRWYNEDTGLYSYGKPDIVLAKEQHETAVRNGYIDMIPSVLIKIMTFLVVIPFFRFLFITLISILDILCINNNNAILI